MKLARNKYLILFPIFFIVLLSVYVYAGKSLMWPLELPKSLSATLGEIRGYSLHQGIDIKTKGRVGYPVFAASSGKLSRLISKERGYGNAIFIDHGNGMQSVYGHLDSFEEEPYYLNTLAKTLKVLYNSDNVDFKFFTGNLPYEELAKIAYTGESGSGFPHLHFEIRDENKFVNPLSLVRIPDRQPPVIENIFVCIEKNNSTVKEKKIWVKEKSGIYLPVKQPVRAVTTERIFFKLSCYDHIGARNRVAVYGIKLYADGRKIFETGFDTITKSDLNYGRLVYDISKSRIKDGVSYAYFLCRRDNHKFDGVKANGSGYISLKDGNKNIKIEVFDFAGNISTLKFRLAQGKAKAKLYNFIYVEKGKKYKLRNQTRDVKVMINTDSLYNGTLLKVGAFVSPRIFNKIRKLSAVSKKDIFNLVSILPSDCVYKNYIKISFRKPKWISEKETENIFIYNYFEGRKPRPLDTKYNPRKGVFEALSRTNGYFALIRDRVPPRIFLPPTHEFCKDKGFYRKIRLYTSDNLSRIDKESIECIIDGEAFPSKFDKDRKWIEISLPVESFSKGSHHIFVKLADRAKNQAVFRDIFMGSHGN